MEESQTVAESGSTQINRGDRLTLSAGDLVPPLLRDVCLRVQNGESVNWAEMRAALRNGLVNRRHGLWSLTTGGLRAAAIARGVIAPGGIVLDTSLLEGEEMDLNAVKGEGLAAALNRAIEEMAGDSRSEEQKIVKAMTEAAGISTGTVRQILRGEIMRPPDDRLRGFAKVLKLKFETLRDLAMEDAGESKSDMEKQHGEFFVGKDRNGLYRWVTVSSTGHQDRDGQFVTTKALTEDVARADGDGDYGPLVWWHEKEKMVLGQCDFNAMTGPDNTFLIESGTFDDEEVALVALKNAGRLGISIGFNYGQHDLDTEGAYWRARRKERSLLPRERASNLFTVLDVVAEKESETMNPVKYQAFVSLFESEEAGHAAAQRIAGRMQKAAQTAASQGIAHKEAGGDSVPGTLATSGDGTDGNQNGGVTGEKSADGVVDEIDAGDFQTLVTKSVSTALAPLTAQMSGIVENFDGIKSRQEQLAGQVADLSQQVVGLKNEQSVLALGLKEVQEGVPAMGNIYDLRATNSADNVMEKDASHLGGPQVDPLISSTFGF